MSNKDFLLSIASRLRFATRITSILAAAYQQFLPNRNPNSQAYTNRDYRCHALWGFQIACRCHALCWFEIRWINKDMIVFINYCWTFYPRIPMLQVHGTWLKVQQRRMQSSLSEYAPFLRCMAPGIAVAA